MHRRDSSSACSQGSEMTAPQLLQTAESSHMTLGTTVSVNSGSGSAVPKLKWREPSSAGRRGLHSEVSPAELKGVASGVHTSMATTSVYESTNSAFQSSNYGSTYETAPTVVEAAFSMNPPSRCGTLSRAAFHTLAAVGACVVVVCACHRYMSTSVLRSDAGARADNAHFMQLRFWVLFVATVLWAISAVCDVLQATRLGEASSALHHHCNLTLIIVRDHLFYVVFTAACVQVAVALIAEPSTTNYVVISESGVSWVYIVTQCVLLADTFTTHHRSRGGPHVLLPASLLLALCSLVVYYAAIITYGATTHTWVYPNQPWVWWGYIVLLALGLGGFCLGRGFTMMSIRLQTGYRVQRALSDGQVCVKRNINYNGRLLHPKWKLNVWFPGVSPSSHLRSHHSSRPVVVFVHGGMYRFGDRGAVDNIGCAWAQNGCVVVTPSYRLFRPCGSSFPDPIVDVANALRWTFKHIQEYGGDPDKVFLVGHSAGGHAVASLACSPQFLADVGVDKARLAGVAPVSAARIDRMFGNEGSLLSRVLCCCCPAFRSGTSDAVKLDVRPAVDLSKASSEDAERVPPLLLIHGTHEYSSVLRSHRSFATLARKAGVRSVQLVSLPGEAHLSETLRVGLTDDTLSSVVLRWVEERGAAIDARRYTQEAAL